MGKIYAGGSTFKNYNNKVKVNARGFNSDVSNHGNQVWSGYHAGVSLVKENPIFNFELDARYENQEGLEDKAVALTLNRKF